MRAKAHDREGDRHFQNYILPFVGKGEPDTHTLGKKYLGLDIGTKLSVVAAEIVETPKGPQHHTKFKIGDSYYLIPNSYVEKPPHLVHNPGAEGFQQEKMLHSILVRYGLSDPSFNAAGNVKGPDVPLVLYDKKYNIESKNSLGAKFGEITLTYDDGWAVSEKSYLRCPDIVDNFRTQTAHGIPILEYLNGFWGDPKKRDFLPHVLTDMTDHEPVYHYLKSIQASLLHIRDYGTYSVGHDVTGMSIPDAEEHLPVSFYTVRRYGLGRRVTAYLSLYRPAVSPSSFDLLNEEHVQQLASRLFW